MNDLEAFANGLADRLRASLPSARMDGVEILSSFPQKATIDIFIRPPAMPCPQEMKPYLRAVRVVVYGDGPVKIGTMTRRKPGHYDFHAVVNLWDRNSVDRIVSKVLEQVP